jgi:hypothetical protein
VTAHGANCSYDSEVNGHTDFLFVGQNPGKAKIRRAQAFALEGTYPVKICSFEQLNTHLNTPGVNSVNTWNPPPLVFLNNHFSRGSYCNGNHIANVALPGGAMLPNSNPNRAYI